MAGNGGDTSTRGQTQLERIDHLREEIAKLSPALTEYLHAAELRRKADRRRENRRWFGAVVALVVFLVVGLWNRQQDINACEDRNEAREFVAEAFVDVVAEFAQNAEDPASIIDRTETVVAPLRVDDDCSGILPGT